jgi:exonuclease III
LYNVVCLMITSHRVVAMTHSISSNMFLLTCVYLPCNEQSTFTDFVFKLSVCETLINEYDDHDTVIVGDLNVILHALLLIQSVCAILCKQ